MATRTGASTRKLEDTRQTLLLENRSGHEETIEYSGTEGQKNEGKEDTGFSNRVPLALFREHRTVKANPVEKDSTYYRLAGEAGEARS
ncbi:hypothetical protein EVAR_58976_1 [Eumeta japonica]|uniref:Uncharacterized protein n=1 Tax=Eumeta variegata TaxID=151549 RepID=A0A4C1YJG7_EUMVA|nr:hypothetical protein EVAR_58976_1 [Eumeta japonica]